MISFSVPSVPISVNRAYQSQHRRVGKGKKAKTVVTRVLTAEGKKYKNETKTYIARNFPEQMKFFRPNQPYVVAVEFVFQGREHLYCVGWDDPKKQVENRYKALDVGNRLKLFEDALASATGIDDKHNFVVLLSKTWARDYESTDVWAWNREEEPGNPIDELLRWLRTAQPHRAVPGLFAGRDQGSP